MTGALLRIATDIGTLSYYNVVYIKKQPLEVHTIQLRARERPVLDLSDSSMPPHHMLLDSWDHWVTFDDECELTG